VNLPVNIPENKSPPRTLLRTLLQTKRLGVEIGGKTVCRELDVGITAGQCWGLLGINGVGKTTLLHTLAGLRAPAQGEVLLGEKPLADLPRRAIAQQIGVLLQDDDDAFPGTVMETVLTGRHPWLGQWQWEGEDDRALALAALEDMGLDGLEQRQVNTLSGGERRRLALATLFTQNPQLFLLDEPTNHLDPHHQIELLSLLGQRVTNSERASLMILHDINLATRFCDHLMLLFGDGEKKGEVLSGPAVEVLNTETLSRLYGHPVISVEGPNGPIFLPG
jgi:iron complex transport system ATP-binding protein